MRNQDIRIGARYATKVSGRTVEVECVGVRSVPRRTRGIKTGSLTRWVVATVVDGRVCSAALPKARTAAALRPLPAPRRLARDVLREACAANPVDLFVVARILRTMRLALACDDDRLADVAMRWTGLTRSAWDAVARSATLAHSPGILAAAERRHATDVAECTSDSAERMAEVLCEVL